MSNLLPDVSIRVCATGFQPYALTAGMNEVAFDAIIKSISKVNERAITDGLINLMIDLNRGVCEGFMTYSLAPTIIYQTTSRLMT
ncbi:MAG: hypothetical protein IPO77_21070 [Acidobacteria bacterium]|nr:hypothetical protein [Acidobacteriota bacterium]